MLRRSRCYRLASRKARAAWHSMIEPIWAQEILRLHAQDLTEKGLRALTLLATGSQAAAEEAAVRRSAEEMKREK